MLLTSGRDLGWKRLSSGPSKPVSSLVTPLPRIGTNLHPTLAEKDFRKTLSTKLNFAWPQKAALSSNSNEGDPSPKPALQNLVKTTRTTNYRLESHRHGPTPAKGELLTRSTTSLGLAHSLVLKLQRSYTYLIVSFFCFLAK